MDENDPSARSPFFRFVNRGDSTSDISGLVAYGIYKIQKRAWLEQRTKRTRKIITREEAEEFANDLTEVQIRQIKRDAELALKGFADAIVEQETLPIIRRELGKGTFLRDVWVGVVSAFCWTVFLIVAGLLVALLSPDVFDVIEKWRTIVHGQ